MARYIPPRANMLFTVQVMQINNMYVSFLLILCCSSITTYFCFCFIFVFRGTFSTPLRMIQRFYRYSRRVLAWMYGTHKQAQEDKVLWKAWLAFLRLIGYLPPLPIEVTTLINRVEFSCQNFHAAFLSIFR